MVAVYLSGCLDVFMTPSGHKMYKDICSHKEVQKYHIVEQMCEYESKQTHAVLACIYVDIDLCNPVKRCPVIMVGFT